MATQGDVSAGLSCSAAPVVWLPSWSSFFEVPGDASINRAEIYQNGQLYGIDASSAAAVAALDPRPGENVLDLCCAPGAKFCMIADAMQRSGTLTGVDVSRVSVRPTGDSAFSPTVGCQPCLCLSQRHALCGFGHRCSACDLLCSACALNSCTALRCMLPALATGPPRCMRHCSPQVRHCATRVHAARMEVPAVPWPRHKVLVRKRSAHGLVPGASGGGHRPGCRW